MSETKPPNCRLVMCEDPVTGRWILQPEGKCPRGYIEKVVADIERDGFVVKRAKAIEVVDADEVEAVPSAITPETTP